jgi:hypothetical protein
VKITLLEQKRVIVLTLRIYRNREDFQPQSARRPPSFSSAFSANSAVKHLAAACLPTGRLEAELCYTYFTTRHVVPYEFDLDPNKERANIQKHGISFRRAAGVFWDVNHLSA